MVRGENVVLVGECEHLSSNEKIDEADDARVDDAQGDDQVQEEDAPFPPDLEGWTRISTEDALGLKKEQKSAAIVLEEKKNKALAQIGFSIEQIEGDAY